jgi:hypothetical protein
VATVADVQRGQPSAADPVILTHNYGEAGAIDRYGEAFGLPSAYSGHNAYAEWGPPPDTNGPVILVGEHAPALLDSLFDCQLAAEVDNLGGIDNEERGAPVWACAAGLESWTAARPATAIRSPRRSRSAARRPCGLGCGGWGSGGAAGRSCDNLLTVVDPSSLGERGHGARGTDGLSSKRKSSSRLTAGKRASTSRRRSRRSARPGSRPRAGRPGRRPGLLLAHGLLGERAKLPADGRELELRGVGPGRAALEVGERVESPRLARWRGPESNRGHHYFQGRRGRGAKWEKALQTATFDDGLRSRRSPRIPVVPAGFGPKRSDEVQNPIGSAHKGRLPSVRSARPHPLRRRRPLPREAVAQRALLGSERCPGSVAGGERSPAPPGDPAAPGLRRWRSGACGASGGCGSPRSGAIRSGRRPGPCV